MNLCSTKNLPQFLSRTIFYCYITKIMHCTYIGKPKGQIGKKLTHKFTFHGNGSCVLSVMHIRFVYHFTESQLKHRLPQSNQTKPVCVLVEIFF